MKEITTLIDLLICELFLDDHGHEIVEELVAISSVLLISFTRIINLKFETQFHAGRDKRAVT